VIVVFLMRFSSTLVYNITGEYSPTFNHTAYSNEYDLYLEWNNIIVKIEVKASRAVDFEKPNDPLYIKALSLDSDRPFDMNFQQIKPGCPDVFIWIAVWRDGIRYWVLASKEIENDRYFSKGQHRGNVGEGQLHLNQQNIDEFKNYEVRSIEIKDAAIKAYRWQKGIDSEKAPAYS